MQFKVLVCGNYTVRNEVTIMGDYYDFGFKEVDGYVKAGFIYKNKQTGWNEIFVEFTSDQIDLANEWQDKSNAIDIERNEMIKGWIK